MQEQEKQRVFNPGVFDMRAVGETPLQVHWPLISMAAFLIIHQGVHVLGACAGVCVCVGHGGPVWLPVK